MSDEDEAKRVADEAARQQREADLVDNRIRELYLNPIKGDFDTAHLKAVHAYAFQDLPEHQPGVFREGTREGWIKDRVPEGYSNSYVVHYASRDIESKITKTLDQFGGSESLKGLRPDAAAGRIAELYGDLDHAHGFHEGNSRTLREFTRELAKEAGFTLDWTRAGIGTQERNELYMARDLAVMERAFPDLTPAKAMQANDRVEFEASFVIEALRNDVGERSLVAIIRDGLTPDHQSEQIQVTGQEQPGQEAMREAARSGKSLASVQQANNAPDPRQAIDIKDRTDAAPEAARKAKPGGKSAIAEDLSAAKQGSNKMGQGHDAGRSH